MTAAKASTGLRTAYAVDPVGIGEREPTLRWRVPTDRRGASQTAFRVLVASSPDRLAADDGDVWDAGKRRCDRPAFRYDGPPLAPDEAYHWKVRLWDDPRVRDDPTERQRAILRSWPATGRKLTRPAAWRTSRSPTATWSSRSGRARTVSSGRDRGISTRRR